MNATEIPTRPCRYCGEPVHQEYDPEVHAAYFPGEYQGTAAHYGCRDTKADGPFGVILHHTSEGGRRSLLRYGSLLAAQEMGLYYREANRREWMCGKDLDVIVGTVYPVDEDGTFDVVAETAEKIELPWDPQTHRNHLRSWAFGTPPAPWGPIEGTV